MSKINKLFFYFIFLGIAGFAFLPAWAEEFAPGFDACMQQTETMGQENGCWLRAGKFWGKKLDEQYAKLRSDCKNAPNPEVCRQELKKMQAGWIQYNNLMVKFLRRGLVKDYELETTSNVNEALRFDAESTKKQYEMLFMLDNQ